MEVDFMKIVRKLTISRMALLMMLSLVGLMALAAACGGGGKAIPQAPAAAILPHATGAAHPFQPKRLETVLEIDMYEFYFADPQGQKNPTFKLPAGKTVGIHLHNEGDIEHELAIGRAIKEDEYQEVLTELVPSDLFFYYGQTKAEVEDAKFGELEVDIGVRDVWIRLNIPAELKGEWEIGCFYEGHYEAGMKAKLIVE
jgi:uncharacterized cupredoxin-like copper-binding protein